MKRHRFDPASFIFGVAFVAIAAAAVWTNYDIGVRWFSWAAAALLITTGLALVAGSRNRAREERR